MNESTTFRIIQHIMLDEDRHFIINMTSAEIDKGVVLLDIEIIKKYATYNDNIMDVVGAVGTVNEYGYDTDEQLEIIIHDFENGEFSALFSNNADPIGYTLNVAYATCNVVPIHHGVSGTWCGGAFHDPHRPDPMPMEYSGAGSLGATQKHLMNLGYHMTDEYASWQGAISQPYDFTKQVPSSDYGGLCDYGAFRDHAGIHNDYSYSVQDEEPNPEVFSYIWPSPLWGVYVARWHDNY